MAQTWPNVSSEIRIIGRWPGGSLRCAPCARGAWGTEGTAGQAEARPLQCGRWTGAAWDRRLEACATVGVGAGNSRGLASPGHGADACQ